MGHPYQEYHEKPAFCMLPRVMKVSTVREAAAPKVRVSYSTKRDVAPFLDLLIPEAQTFTFLSSGPALPNV